MRIFGVVAIGANMVVTRDVEENNVVGGTPGKLIRTINLGPLDVTICSLRDE